MYNEDLKKRFVRDYTGSLNTANVAATVFNAVEKYETEWNADLCTRSTEELQPVIDEIVGLRSRSKWMTLTILKEYVKWCIAMKVPGACDGIRWCPAPYIFSVLWIRFLIRRAMKQ